MEVKETCWIKHFLKRPKKQTTSQSWVKAHIPVDNQKAARALIQMHLNRMLSKSQKKKITSVSSCYTSFLFSSY